MAGKAASFLAGVRQIDAKGNIVGEVCAPSPPLCLSAHVPQTTPGSSEFTHGTPTRAGVGTTTALGGGQEGVRRGSGGGPQRKIDPNQSKVDVGTGRRPHRHTYPKSLLGYRPID
eukprot:704688-Prorocentrum_minimum.AAC.1